MDRERSSGIETARYIIIGKLEDVLAKHQVDLLPVRESLHLELRAIEGTVNKSRFLDDIKETIEEYLSSLEELESGKVRKREDYIEEQLRKAEEDYSNLETQLPSGNVDPDDGSAGQSDMD